MFVLALAAAAAPLGAQDERTRLDDFSVAGEGAGSTGEIEQIQFADLPLVEAEDVPDRAIAIPQSSAADTSGRVVQLSATGQLRAPEQLTASADQSVLVPVEGRAQSRPQAVQRLAGTDRCDPQLERAKIDECLRILERRAEQFSAPAAPELSAEQRLLAERQSADREAPITNGDARVRLAGLGTPDADLRSNQELAALVLDRSPPAPPQPPAEQPAPEGLAEVLQGLSIDLQQGPSTPQQ